MRVIKHFSRDFVVDEVSSVPDSSEGPFDYFTLKKTRISTPKAVSLISGRFRVPIKHVGYAGLKDKNAITTQLISIKGVSKGRALGQKFDGMSLEHIGKGSVPVTIGSLEKNKFTITIRNLSDDECLALGNARDYFPNYFGPQRFSSANHLIGRHIVRKEFREAAELIAHKSKGAAEFLNTHPGNYVGTVQAIGRKMATFLIHSYQSFIWNKTASELIKESSGFVEKEFDFGKLAFPNGSIKGQNISVVGYDTTPSGKIQDILKDEGINPRSFIIRSIPNLSCDGSERSLMSRAENLELSVSDDEEFKGKKKCQVSFFLKKGSYATIFIESLFAR